MQESFDIPGGADIIVFGMDFPVVYHPVPVTLTLTVPSEPGGGIIGTSTVTFSVVQPVPEPTSMALFGTGLGVAILRGLRRKKGDFDHGLITNSLELDRI